MNSLVMTLASLTPRDLRNRFILTFQMGKLNASNLDEDLMLVKSCDAMKTSIIAHTNNKYNK